MEKGVMKGGESGQGLGAREGASNARSTSLCSSGQSVISTGDSYFSYSSVPQSGGGKEGHELGMGGSRMIRIGELLSFGFRYEV